MSSATQNADWFETIVAEVMRRLLAQGVSVRTVEEDRETDLEIDTRVVSLETLSGRLEGIGRLVVKADAVVTPSVRDDLRQRNIELVRQNTEVSPD
ncbi:MAG: hypothetical protein VX346_23990 [Planctomycetota bacterium]|nr:hypothetical protein [Planctomycetota bacterium]